MVRVVIGLVVRGDWVIGELYDDIQLSIYLLLLGIRNAFTIVAFSF